MAEPYILVIDDSHTVRTFVQRTLASAGYEVGIATDGIDGLKKVAERLPDAIVLDIQMPLMDGYTVCQKLQEVGEPFASIPVLFLTSLQTEALNSLGQQLGDYLPKPVCGGQLIEAMRKLGCVVEAQPQQTPAS